MKGVIISQFVDDMIDELGLAETQKIINECDLESNGIYTSIGDYHHQELLQLAAKMALYQNKEVQEVVQNFGLRFFSVIVKSYPQLVEGTDLFSFLSFIDNYIHPEVLKLYPDARLPKFNSRMLSATHLQMDYTSERKLGHFAIGLIYGASKYFDEPVTVNIEETLEDGKEMKMNIQKIGKA